MQNLKAQLAKLKGRDIFLLTLVVLVLFAMLWYFQSYQANKLAIDDARGRLETLQTTVLTSRQAAAELPGLQAEVAALEKQSAELLRALPATTSMGEVVDEIRKDIGASGAQMLSVSQSGSGAPGQIPAGVRPIALSLSVKGRFGELYGVLRSLEGMSRFSTINALTLGATDKIRDPNLTGNIGVTVYTFDPSAAQPASAAPTPAGTTPAPAAPATAPAAPPAGGNS
ncbi:type 4a pilus biogenesis protein PilO [Deinococcus pimensis]|uniref:type 4a pilus biogenesis protein PilO n=1 Tax=Deinococcus pimensis TaxID=309888 RepID=UPI0004B425FC|nr:type 4a pilus biogenesis protein PilO [Deinococcus pimensis]